MPYSSKESRQKYKTKNHNKWYKDTHTDYYSRGAPEFQPRKDFCDREDKEILDKLISDRELSVKWNRSIRSIQIRRSRLKKKYENNIRSNHI